MAAEAEQDQKQGMKRASAQNARLNRAQVASALDRAAQSTASENFKSAREALAARGQIKNLNLSDRPASAILRAVSFEEGVSKSIRQQNLELKRMDAGAQLRGIQITRASEKAQINDSNLVYSAQIINAVLGGGQMGSSTSQGINSYYGSESSGGSSGGSGSFAGFGGTGA